MNDETAVFVISDLHYGKETASFTPNVFKKRVERITQKLAAIKDLMSGYTFDKLVVVCLGDVNDGSDIYATQSHHQAITNVEEQAYELSEILAKWLVNLKEIWDNVEFAAVPGNHGRSGFRMHEAASWDIVTYRYLAMRLKASESGIDVKFNDNNGDPFIQRMSIRGHGYLLYHGHDIRTYGQIPWYGMQLRALRWATAIPAWETLLLGHFHTSGIWSVNKLTLLCTGTMVTDDEWALRTFGWQSQNKWWLFGVSNKYSMTWNYQLDIS